MSENCIIIDMQEGRHWQDCPICGRYERLDHAIAWYEGPVAVEIGECVPGTNDRTAGMLICKECHDRLYGEAEGV